MSPPTAPPFPFYIINKDIIKGSFPFRKTFLTPKLDFEARFRPPRVFRRPEEPEQNYGNGTNLQRSPISQPNSNRPACSADPKSRNRTTETEQTCSEARFRNPIQTVPRVPPTRRAATELRKRNKSEARESFPVRRTLQSEEYSIFAPEGFGTRFQTLPSGPSESPLLSPFRHRYCQVNPPAERLKKHARQHLQSSYFSR